jgi:hypothetical protein
VNNLPAYPQEVFDFYFSKYPLSNRKKIRASRDIQFVGRGMSFQFLIVLR